MNHQLAKLAVVGIACWGVASAHAKPRPPWPPAPEAILNGWRFDVPAWMTEPRCAPLTMEGVQEIESWSGYAIRVAGDGPDLLALPNHAPDGTTNLVAEAGTVRFWFAPEWTSAPEATGPGAEARLLEIGAWSATGAQSWWALSINPAGDTLRFLAQGGGVAIEILRAPIHWCVGEWHQVALSWSVTGKTVLYLDGQRVAEGPGVALTPLTRLDGVAGFCLGSDVHGGNPAQGEFDELYTFDRVCREEEVAWNYELNASRAALGPLTLEEEQAWRKELAQQAALSAESGGGANNMAGSAGTDYGCGLWLEIGPSGSNAVLLTLHNTTPGTNYQILSKTNLSSVSWAMETNLTGASGQDYTQATVPMLQRPHLFLIASEAKDYSMETNYAGLSFSDTQFDPPDTMGAVGPNHFVELLNGKIAVFNKTNGQRLAEEWTTNFFAVTNGMTAYPTGVMFDNRILYDAQANRWVACSIDGDTPGSQQVILAISNNQNPTNLISNWSKYVIPVAQSGFGTDFVTLGVDGNGIYVSAWHSGSNTVAAIKKPEIIQGTLVATILTLPGLSSEPTTIQPAVNFDAVATNACAWFVTKGPPEGSSTNDYKGGAILYRRLQWNNTNAVWTDTTWRTVSDSNPTYRNYLDLDEVEASAPQAGGAGTISLFTGSRLMMAVIRDGFLYTCHQVGLNRTNGVYVGNGAGLDRTGIQWFKLQIRPEIEALTYYRHGRIYDDAMTNSFYYYMPSMMVNCAGDMVLGFSGSSQTNFISAYYSWRPASGPMADKPKLIQAGLGYYDDFRWGDYSYTSLDPNDSVSFWTVQEYAKQTGAAWGTGIGKIRGDQ